jgi:hypothetical protein
MGLACTRRAALGAAVAVAASCTRTPPPRRAFHYWRTTLSLSAVERRALADLGIERLYLRLFDVDWGPGGPCLLGALTGDGGALPPAVEVVPVVFIRAQVLRHLAGPAAATLAGQLWRAVEAELARIGRRAAELQIDCDWAASDQAAFFALLRALHARSGVPLSATIRLHQVKYRERTGVPPVARGLLMFYNMGAIDADPAAHAIFDATRAAAYLGRIGDYPLPLDVALPIWSWVVHVRGDQVAGLLQDTDPAELPGLPWLHARGEGRFEVMASSFLHGVLLRQGDYLDVEETTPADLEQAAALVAPRLAAPRDRRTVSLFHLSENNLARHETVALARLFARFR